jgi:hypothetical protein
MSNWRERAREVRAAAERRQASGAAPAGPRVGEPARAPQAAYARQVIDEVLVPVFQEVVGILTGSPGKPVVHEYGPWNLGVTCELDFLRFQANVYLLEGKAIRVAVSLLPTFGEGSYAYYKDFEPQARKAEIEAWFGDTLVKMYENR